MVIWETEDSQDREVIHIYGDLCFYRGRFFEFIGIIINQTTWQGEN